MTKRKEAEPEHEYLTTAEVAAMLRVSKPTVLAAVRDQNLPGIQVGKQWRFARVDVLAWVQGRKEARHGGRAA